MGTSILFQNLSAVSATNLPWQMVPVYGPNSDAPHSPPTQQTFVISLTGIGACSVTVVFVGSIDGGRTWQQVAQFTAAGTSLDTTGGASAATTSSNSFSHYGAYVSAISGENAAATARVST